MADAVGGSKGNSDEPGDSAADSPESAEKFSKASESYTVRDVEPFSQPSPESGFDAQSSLDPLGRKESMSSWDSSVPFPAYPGQRDDEPEEVFGVKEAFLRNASPWALSSLIYIAVGIIIGVAFADGQQLMVSSLGNFLMGLLSFMVTLNFYRNAIRAIDGEVLELKDFFSFQYLGYMLLTNILVAVLMMLGLLVFIIGSLFVIFFTYWSTMIVLDYSRHDRSPIPVLQHSFTLAKNNPGKVFLAMGVAILIGFGLGIVLYFVPAGYTLMSVPFTVIFALFLARYYRQIQPASSALPEPFSY